MAEETTNPSLLVTFAPMRSNREMTFEVELVYVSVSFASCYNLLLPPPPPPVFSLSVLSDDESSDSGP